jgi:hypothetical protein
MTEYKGSGRHSGLLCGDAYRLMTYRDDQGNEEQVWNSRNGVVPFYLTLKGGTIGTHVNWDQDVFDPYYIPPIGSRVFTGLTFKKAQRLAQQRAKGMDTKHLREVYGSKNNAVRIMTDDLYRRGENPDIVEVDQDLQDTLKARAERWKVLDQAEQEINALAPLIGDTST